MHAYVYIYFFRFLGLFKHSQELNRNYLSKILPSSRHSLAFGRFNAFSSLGFILGPLVGGHMTDMKYGYHAIATTTAGIFFLSSCKCTNLHSWLGCSTLQALQGASWSIKLSARLPFFKDSLSSIPVNQTQDFSLCLAHLCQCWAYAVSVIFHLISVLLVSLLGILW